MPGRQEAGAAPVLRPLWPPDGGEGYPGRLVQPLHPARPGDRRRLTADQHAAALLNVGDQVAFLYDIALGNVQPGQRA